MYHNAQDAGNYARANRIRQIYYRYANNIISSRSYQTSRYKYDRIKNINSNKANAIIDRADNRKYARSTYMGLKNANGGKG